MNCPDCGAELSGSDNLYACDYCRIQYRVDFTCDKCGGKPEYLGDENPGHFYCRTCDEVFLPPQLRKKYIKIGPLVRKGYNIVSSGEEGYTHLLSSGPWKMVVINFTTELSPDKLKSMYRYQNAESVYVVLGDSCSVRIILGGDSGQPSRFEILEMQPRNVYTVDMNTWHAVVMDEGDSILQVTTGNGTENSYEYCSLEPEQQDKLLRELKLNDVSAEMSCL